MVLQNQNIENTLKKMGLVLEKVVQKIDELDKRVANIEEKLGENEKKFSSGDFKTTQAQMQQNPKNSTSKSLSNGFGGSFLGLMTGAMAGMGLYNLLFNHTVTPLEFGENLGMNQNEINGVLDNNFDEIDSKLDELENSEDVMNSDYFESYEKNVTDDDFGGGFDDI